MSGYDDEDYASSIDMGVWKRLYGIAKAYKGKFAIVGGLAFVVGAVDASWAFMTGWIVDHAIVPGSPDAILAFIPFYLAVIGFQAFAIKAFIDVSGRIDMGICCDIRRLAFAKLRRLSFSYYDRANEGWIISRLTGDVGKLSDVMAWGVLDMCWGAMMMLVMAVVLLSLNLVLGLVTLAVLPPLLYTAAWFRKRILAASRDARKEGSRLTAAFSEGIRGARAIKSLAAEGLFKEEFAVKARRLKGAQLRMAIYQAVLMPLVVFLAYLGTSLSLFTGGGMVLGGAISIGSLVAFVFTAIQFFEPVSELSRVLSEFQQAQASAERVLSLLGKEPEIEDSEDVRASSGDHLGSEAQARLPLKGEVRFEDVSFAYGTGEKVFENFDLEIEAGTSLAVVGETGSGKSSLANLMCRFYEPTSGRILIDGVDYRERSQSWLHAHLGYVLQTPSLFSGSVRENIRYGRLSASDEEVEEAARAVGAHEFIMRLADGYDTDAGLGGSLLSTGQKQLVSFARALIADPRILILDEATSSVDSETERLMQEAVGKVLAGRTSLVIAHRLSTVARADRIIVLDKGRIVEDGSHRELLALGGRYRALYEGQFLAEGETAALGA
jgi:ATP-binding cassette subfamily B protein